MKPNTNRRHCAVTVDGERIVNHAGSVALTDLADTLQLTQGLTAAMAPTRVRRSEHDPGVVLRDLGSASSTHMKRPVVKRAGAHTFRE